MADRPAVKTQHVRRDELAAVLVSPRLVKAFENMADDVSQTLPDAAKATAQAASRAQARADAAKDAAEAAQADATEALTLIDELDGEPAAQLAALREELGALRGRIAALEQGITA
jgi:hypothetical protein